MIKAVIFDADGVLITSERFSSKLAREHGITFEMTTPFFQGAFQKCLVGECDLKEEIKNHLPDWGWKGSMDEFIDYWFTSAEELDTEIIDFIKKLKKKGFKVYVGTNNERHRTTYMKDRMGFGEVFDRVYGSGHVGYKKPDHKFFQHIIDDAGLKKEEVLFWDDDMENIEAANEFGINAHLYTNFEDFKQKMRKLVAN